MSKIGIDITSSSAEVLKGIQEIEKNAASAQKAIESLNKKLDERNRLMQEQSRKLSDLNKVYQQMKGDGSLDAINGGNAGDRHTYSGSSGSGGRWGSAIGAAMTGDFGAVISASTAALGQAMGGRTGAFIGAATGRVASSIWNRLSQSLSTAERNMIQTSYLRRSIGADPSGFNRLYSNIQDASQQIGGMLNSETIQLFRTIAKASGSSDIDTLKEDSVLAGQYGKALGMDVNVSGRFFGQMRGIGMASSHAEMRRLGLVIAESIGRTGAFAKADEMMGAVSNYATQLERITLNKNQKAVENYAGLLSTLASGDNKDIAGFASMLGQVDSGYRSGGQMGLASWTLRLMGYQAGYSSRINALDVRAFNEQGAMGSPADVVRPGSKYYQFASSSEKRHYDAVLADMRRNGSLNRSNLENEVDQLRKRTGGGMKLAYSLANHYGLQSSSQAIDLVRAVDASRRYGGVGNRLKRYGLETDDTQQQFHAAIYLEADEKKLQEGAKDLLAGKGFTNSLDKSEREKLEKALASGNKEELRKMVINLSGTREWEEDQGKRLEGINKSIENKTEMVGSHLADIKGEVLALVNHFIGDRKPDEEAVGEAVKNMAASGAAGGAFGVGGGGSIGAYSGGGITGSGADARFTNDEAGMQAAFWTNVKGESNGSAIWTKDMAGYMRKAGVPLSDIGKTIYNRNGDGTIDYGPTQLNNGGRLQNAFKKIGVDPSLAKNHQWLLNHPDVVAKAAIADYAEEFKQAQKYYGGRVRETLAHHHLPGLMPRMWRQYGADWVNHPNERSRDGYRAELMIGSSGRKQKLLQKGLVKAGTLSTDNTANQPSEEATAGRKGKSRKNVNVHVKGTVRTETASRQDDDADYMISAYCPEVSLYAEYGRD